MTIGKLPSGLRVGVQLVRQGKVKYSVSITHPSELAKILAYLGKQDREHFMVVHLDSKNSILGMETVSIGSLNYAIVHPRECFKAALLLNAASVILVHNHPSGALEPSEEDINLTKRLVQAGRLLGIEVLDHIIISGAGHMSFKERHQMPEYTGGDYGSDKTDSSSAGSRSEAGNTGSTAGSPEASGAQG